MGPQNLAGESRSCEWCSRLVTDNPLVKVTGWIDLPGLGRKVGIFRVCSRCAAIRAEHPIRAE